MTTLLSINNYYYHRAGAEAVFLDHNRLLEGRGWNVVPFAMRHPDNLASDWSPYFADEIEFGHSYGPVQKARMALKTIYSLKAQKKLKRLIAASNPAICHAHNIYHHLSPAILSTVKKSGIPVVLTTHDLKIACPAYKMLNKQGICERCRGGKFVNVIKHRCMKGSLALSALVYVESQVHWALQTYKKQVDRFVVPSRFYLDKFAEWGFEQSQMTYIPNCIDVSNFQPREAVGNYFVFAGRLAPEKGVATLIQAAHKAGTALKILGSGPEEQALKSLAARLNAPVEFTGFLKPEQVQALLSQARALVLPSEWYENAPISILEAYASGIPVIGADIGGIPEMIENGVTGVTFASGNVAALSAALEQLAEMPETKLLEMGAAGRQLVEQNYSREHYSQRVLSLYSELGVREVA